MASPSPLNVTASCWPEGLKILLMILYVPAGGSACTIAANVRGRRAASFENMSDVDIGNPEMSGATKAAHFIRKATEKKARWSRSSTCLT